MSFAIFPYNPTCRWCGMPGFVVLDGERAERLLAALDELEGLRRAVLEEGHVNDCRGEHEGIELCDCPYRLALAAREAKEVERG